MFDFFDPNTWALAEPFEFRIYGDDNAQTWGVVDEEDYHFLIQWKWSWDNPGMRNGKLRRAPRLRRNFEVQIESPYVCGGTYINPETGREVRHRKPRIQKTLLLHVVVMLRTGITPPTPDHELVDHLDGDHTNCRRNNLRWATHEMNGRNRFGSALMEMENGRENLSQNAILLPMRDGDEIDVGGSQTPPQFSRALPEAEV